jgi:hypothetical protein
MKTLRFEPATLEVKGKCAKHFAKFFLTSFQARVHEMFLNIYLTSRPPFVCQNYTSISCCHLSSFPWQGKIFPHTQANCTHKQIFQGKIARLNE